MASSACRRCKAAGSSAQTIEAGRIAATQYIRGEGRLYVRVFPHKSITSIPLETRMGKGKGEPEYWAAVVQAGHGPVRAGRRDRSGGQDVLRAAGSQDADPRADGEAEQGLDRQSELGEPSIARLRRTMTKANELRDMSDEQLELTLKEAIENLFRLRMQAADRAARRPQRAAPQPPADRPDQDHCKRSGQESRGRCS